MVAWRIYILLGYVKYWIREWEDLLWNCGGYDGVVFWVLDLKIECWIRLDWGNKEPGDNSKFG